MNIDVVPAPKWLAAQDIGYRTIFADGHTVAVFEALEYLTAAIVIDAAEGNHGTRINVDPTFADGRARVLHRLSIHHDHIGNNFPVAAEEALTLGSADALTLPVLVVGIEHAGTG